jgi:hypothetical protein
MDASIIGIDIICHLFRQIMSKPVAATRCTPTGTRMKAIGCSLQNDTFCRQEAWQVFSMPRRRAARKDAPGVLVVLAAYCDLANNRADRRSLLASFRRKPESSLCWTPAFAGATKFASFARASIVKAWCSEGRCLDASDRKRVPTPSLWS